MPNLEARIAQFERQLGRKLTADERRLTRWWYDAFEAKKKLKRPIKSKKASASR